MVGVIALLSQDISRWPLASKDVGWQGLNPLTDSRQGTLHTETSILRIKRPWRVKIRPTTDKEGATQPDTTIAYIICRSDVSTTALQLYCCTFIVMIQFAHWPNQTQPVHISRSAMDVCSFIINILFATWQQCGSIYSNVLLRSININSCTIRN